MKKKILLYADLNINVVDGSSVWLVSLAKLLSNDQNNLVDILLKRPITNSVLVKELFYRENVSFIEAKEFIRKVNFVDDTNVAKIMEKIDYVRDYSCIIARGFEAVNAIVKKDSLAKKLIPYITNFCHNKNEIKKSEKQSLLQIYNKVNHFFVQTKQMQSYLEEILLVNGEKFKILSPMIFENSVNCKNEKTQKSIVYAGKLAKDWNILELLDIMDRLYQKDSEITLHFIGDKFGADLKGQKDEILNRLKNMPNVKYYGSLPKEETTRIINSCQLGYSFRSSAVDNDESLELSSKLLEYCFCKTPVILRKTKIHTDILGEDYPFFAESVDECVNKIFEFFENLQKYNNVSEVLRQRVERFEVLNIYKNVQSALREFPSKKLRLLITGHDLKFIKGLFPFFAKKFELTVQEYPEYTNLDAEKSRKLLQKNDIIWCEWLLLNAKWYSQNKYSFQKLFIRAHKFEISKNYGKNVNWNNVNKLITVAYYWQEQFAEKFNIPRSKVTVINNFVDVKSYSSQKKEGYKYNIGMIGILPKLKGFARAVEVLKELKKHDNRYKLFIAGKKPQEFANTWNVPSQRQYYLDTFKEIEDSGLTDSVIYTGWVETAKFLENVGYTLSLSDKTFPESFHLAPFECMASGGVGLAVCWDGIEYVYPEFAVEKNLFDIAKRIIALNQNDDEYKGIAQKGKEFVVQNYDITVIWESILKTINQ